MILSIGSIFASCKHCRWSKSKAACDVGCAYKAMESKHCHTCCGSGISLRVRGLSHIKLHPEYQSLKRSSTSLIIPGK